MATDPKATKIQPLPPGEIAPPEDPFHPLRFKSQSASPFVDLLQPEDSILSTKGGIDNLKIYKELLRDDQVASTWQQRRLSLTSCDTVVEPGGEDALSKKAADALQVELDGMDWDGITDKMLYAIFYGWGVAEVLWRPNGELVSFDRIIVRDRSRFRFDRNRNLYLWATGSGWQLMPDRKFWTVSNGADHDDEPYGLGLAHSLYWPVFFKRNDIKFWLVFLEKFGMPTTLAKLPSGAVNDPVQKNAAIAMLRNIATDAGVVVPDNVVVELLEASRSANVDYAGMHDAMNGAISKIVVGQTMTTDDGSSLAQGQVHERVAQSLTEADSDLLCESFNRGPVRWWTEFNFPGAKLPRVYRHTAPEEDLNARAERDAKIKALGYSPTADYIIETYGEGWEKAEPPPALALAGQLPPGSGEPAFGEGEFMALQALRQARRGDQDALIEAAVMFAEQYQSIMGKQVGAILEQAEFSEDPDLLRRKIDELLESGPTLQQVEPLSRANIFSRMMGALRSQRKAA